MDVFSKSEAAYLWAIKDKTLEMRLFRDNTSPNKKMMFGTRKSGGNWIVTREYMEDRYGSQKRDMA